MRTRLSESESQMLAQLAHDADIEGAYLMREDGRIVMMDQRGLDKLGYTVEDLDWLTGSDINPLAPPERLKPSVEHFKRTKRASFKSIHKSKDGQEHSVSGHAQYFEHEGTGYIYMKVRYEDDPHLDYGIERSISNIDELDRLRATNDKLAKEIADRISAQEKNEEQDGIIDAIFQSLNGLFILEPVYENNQAIDFLCIRCNDAAAQMGGFANAAEIIGKCIGAERPAFTNTELFNTYKRVIESGVAKAQTTFYAATVGRWFLLDISRLFHDHLFVSVIDATELKNTQNRLAEVVRQNEVLLNGSNVAIYTVERRFVSGEPVLYVTNGNQIFLSNLNAPIDESGTPVLELIPEVMGHEIYGQFLRAFESEEKIRFESYFNLVNGQGWYDVTIIRVNPDLIVVTYLDVTEKHNYQHRIESLLSEQEALLNGTQVGFLNLKVITKPDGEKDLIILSANHIVNRVLSLYDQSYIGEPLENFFPNIHKYGLFELYLSGAEADAPIQVEVYYEDDNLNDWFDVSIFRQNDNSVSLSFVVITARKELEAKQEKLVEDLKRSNAELETFAYAASHDLQEPLRMINSFSRLLEEELNNKLTDQTREYFGFVQEGATRMSHLIRGLLTYSRIGRTELQRKKVDVKDVINLALHDLYQAVNEKSAEVQFGEMPIIMADDTLLHQVFCNLISNAIKFSRPGIKPTLSITASHDEEFWRFEVADNGIGIQPEHRSRIFSLFQRLNARELFVGEGMGLALCKKSVELHQGAIWVEPRKGGGSTFIFTIKK